MNVDVTTEVFILFVVGFVIGYLKMEFEPLLANVFY